jgi:hypothetical protein
MGVCFLNVKLSSSARKELEQSQAWHASDVSASPEQGKACELAGVTPARQARPFRALLLDSMCEKETY